MPSPPVELKLEELGMPFLANELLAQYSFWSHNRFTGRCCRAERVTVPRQLTMEKLL